MMLLGLIYGFLVGQIVMALYFFIVIPWLNLRRRTCGECAEFQMPYEAKDGKMYAGCWEECIKDDGKYRNRRQGELFSGELPACRKFIAADERKRAKERTEKHEVYRK